jgi:hypothetical protein
MLSIASKVSNLRADSAEIDIALAAMNRAYLRACLDCELTGNDASYTMTATAETIAASAIAATGVYRVQHLRLVSASVRVPLQQVSRQELLDYRATEDIQGLPFMYSVSMVGSEPKVDFYPTISIGDQLKMAYLAAPTLMTSAATTASPDYMPDMFHHDIITNAAIGALLERDGKTDAAQIWNARSLEGMSRLEEYLGQMGGTANRSWYGPDVNRSHYPDTHRR